MTRRFRHFPTTVPTLAELVEQPGRVAEVPAEVAHGYICHLGGLLSGLTACVAAPVAPPVTPPAPTTPAPSLTIAEVASITRLSKPYLYELIRAGRLPHTRLGRRVYVRPDSLTAWLAKHEAGA